MDSRMSFVNSEIMRNQVYHNHKENMAWVATSLYISGALIFGWNLNDIVFCCQKAIVIIVALSITGLAFCFVCWQFNNRKIAASRVKELIDTAKKLCPQDGNNELEWYFKSIYEHKDDPDKSMWISLAAMSIALVVFLVLISC